MYASSIFQALDYALKMGANIISCSFSREYSSGFAPFWPPSPWEEHGQETAAFTKALEPLTRADVLVVAAAGKEGVCAGIVGDVEI